MQPSMEMGMSMTSNGYFESETLAYLSLPGVSLTPAQIVTLDANIKLIKYGAGITLSSLTMKRSDVNGTAFITNPSVDLRPYVGFKITLNDTGTGAVGWIQAAGMAETLSGIELISNPELTTVTTGYVPTGDLILARVDSSSDPGTNSTSYGAVDKWCLKATATATQSVFVTTAAILSVGALIKFGGIFYAPSSNTKINAGTISLVGTVFHNPSEDAWNTLSGYVTSTSTSPGMYFSVRDINNLFSAGDVVYFDKVSAQQNTAPSATGVTIWDLTVQNWVTIGSTPNAASFTAVITKS